MVYYGPWIQGGDYQRTGTDADVVGPVSPNSGAVSTHEAVYPDPGDNNWNPETNEVLDAVGSAVDPFGNGLQAVLTASISPGTQIGEALGTGEHTRGSYVHHANTLNDAGWYASGLTLPPGAYSVELEYGLSLPVGASFEHTILAVANDDSVTPAQTNPAAPVTVTFYMGNANLLTDLTISSPPVGGDLVGEVIPGANGTQYAISGDASSWLAHDYQGAFYIHADVTKTGPWALADNSRHASIQHGARSFSQSVTYTLRPPRHRFVYETEPTPTTALSPLQQYPRNDGRRSSSAPQHYPPSKSRQSSNQHFGGYF